jgi:Ubiquinol cytochrome reductase transmembrane region
MLYVCSDKVRGTPTRAADESRRAFSYFVLGAFGVTVASAAKQTVVCLLDSLNPSADVLAMANVEFDLASVDLGKTSTIKWRVRVQLAVCVCHGGSFSLLCGRCVEREWEWLAWCPWWRSRRHSLVCASAFVFLFFFRVLLLSSISSHLTLHPLAVFFLNFYFKSGQTGLRASSYRG